MRKVETLKKYLGRWEDFEERTSKRLKSFEETARTCLMNLGEDIGKGLKECEENVIGNWRKEVFAIAKSWRTSSLSVMWKIENVSKWMGWSC